MKPRTWRGPGKGIREFRKAMADEAKVSCEAKETPKEMPK